MNFLTSCKESSTEHFPNSDKLHFSDYSIHLSFVKNGPIKTHNFTHLLPWFQKIGPNIPTRGNCIGNTTSDPSDNF
jgi:hypothetical protein